MTCWLCGFETTELVTDAKAAICKDGPCHICVAITKVDEEINQAVATLQHLVAKRCNLRSEQNRAHDPIHRLPLEIRNYTFELVLPERNKWGRLDRPPAVMPPYLTSICRSWRDIVWSNPFLWSRIPILLGRPSTSDRSSSWIKSLQSWLLRSRTLPLSLEISAHKAEGVEEEELKIVLDAIGQSSTRWHSLGLQLPPGLLCAFQHNNFQLQRLHTLEIEVAEPGTFTEPLSFLNQVNPEQITTIGVPFHSLSVSWDHLTFASVLFCTLGEVAQLLQHASQMNLCRIIGVHNFDPHATLPRVIHQKLLALSVCEGEELAAKLLGSLTLPSLEEFHCPDVGPLRYLPAFVQRSSCPLTRLRLFGPYVAAHAVDGLQPFSGVTGLYLESRADPSGDVYLTYLIQNLDQYFPDLLRLKLRPNVFTLLWGKGIIPMLLDQNKRPQSDTSNSKERGLRKIVVQGLSQIHDFRHMVSRDSEIGKQLKALNVSVRLRDSGFCISIPEAPSKTSG